MKKARKNRWDKREESFKEKEKTKKEGRLTSRSHRSWGEAFLWAPNIPEGKRERHCKSGNEKRSLTFTALYPGKPFFSKKKKGVIRGQRPKSSSLQSQRLSKKRPAVHFPCWKRKCTMEKRNLGVKGFSISSVSKYFFHYLYFEILKKSIYFCNIL